MSYVIRHCQVALWTRFQLLLLNHPDFASTIRLAVQSLCCWPTIWRLVDWSGKETQFITNGSVKFTTVPRHSLVIYMTTYLSAGKAHFLTSLSIHTGRDWQHTQRRSLSNRIKAAYIVFLEFSKCILFLYNTTCLFLEMLNNDWYRTKD